MDTVAKRRGDRCCSLRATLALAMESIRAQRGSKAPQRPGLAARQQSAENPALQKAFGPEPTLSRPRTPPVQPLHGPLRSTAAALGNGTLRQ